MGRPPIGKKAMSGAERIRRYRERKVAIALKLMGVHSESGKVATISDIRRAAGLNAGDAFAKKMMKAGYLRHLGRDQYSLTPAGTQLADPPK